MARIVVHRWLEAEQGGYGKGRWLKVIVGDGDGPQLTALMGHARQQNPHDLAALCS
jgi:hypothetical protein